LSEDEIKRMVSDAEAHADEDRRFHELVDARNKADNMIHAVKKSLTELGDKVSADEKSAVEKAVDELQAAMKGDDKAAIEAKTNSLTQASAKIAEHAYAQAQQASGAEQAASSAGGAGDAKENVVDAEFEEVKEERRKS
jgi:molecular chaperone DnaK